MERISSPRRQTAIVLGALVTILVALGAGAWGLAADRGGHEHGHGEGVHPDWVAVPGGFLQVAEVTNRSMDHKRVPGMATMPDADPVPPGMVRIVVGIVLAADDHDLTWSETDFRLGGGGIASLPPHTTDLGDGVVPRGSQVSGALTFDVPESASGLALRFRDGPPVRVRTEPTSHGHDDHDDHDHDDHGHDDHGHDDHGHDDHGHDDDHDDDH